MLRLDWNLLWTALNLLIWYILIRKFLLKPINKIIDQRDEINNKKLAEADAAKREALDLKAQHEAELKNIDEEREKLLAETREEAARESERVIEDAREQAGRIVEKAKVSAAEEHERMLRESREEMAELVAAATAKVMMANVDEAGNRKMYDDFLKKEGAGGE